MSAPTTIAPAQPETTAETASPKRRSKASVGAFWSIAGYGGTNSIRLISNLTLTRLLFPEHFGMMALVTVFMSGLQMFSDIGVGPNIVQSERGDDPRFLNTAWTMQVMRGFVLWMIACAGAAPFAAFYDEPLLAVIIPISGFTAFLAGLNSTKLYTQLRTLNLKRFVSVDLISSVVGMLVMIAWAFYERSIWALVSGGVASCVTKLILTHTLLPGAGNRFAWDKEAARSIFRFGGWIFISTIFTFLDRQADKLIFATMIPMGILGVYSVGALVATFPTSALGYLNHNVLFPLYSGAQQRGEAVAPIFARARFSVLLVAGWALSGFVAGGQIVIDLAWDDTYAGAGWIVQLLSIGAWFSIMEHSNGTAFLARGQANMLALANAGKVIAMIVLIPIGFALAEFPGAVVAYAITEIFKYAISAITIARAGLSGWRRDFCLTCMLAFAAVLATLAGELARGASGYTIVGAIAVFIVATAAWAPLAFVWKSRLDRAGKSFFGD